MIIAFFPSSTKSIVVAAGFLVDFSSLHTHLRVRAREREKKMKMKQFISRFMEFGGCMACVKYYN